MQRSVGPLDEVNLQDVICSLDQFCDIPFRRERQAKFLGDMEPDAVLKQIGSFAIDHLAELDWAADHWAVNILAAVDSNCTVITTNYDTLAEQILSWKIDAVHCGPNATCFHCRMRDILLTCCACDVAERDGTPWKGSLLKLHGSIAWQQCTNSKCSQFGCILPDCRCQPQQMRPCDYCRARTRLRCSNRQC